MFSIQLEACSNPAKRLYCFFSISVVVRLKYPRVPCSAHKEARTLANQMGLDFKQNDEEKTTIVPEK